MYMHTLCKECEEERKKISQYAFEPSPAHRTPSGNGWGLHLLISIVAARLKVASCISASFFQLLKGYVHSWQLGKEGGWLQITDYWGWLIRSMDVWDFRNENLHSLAALKGFVADLFLITQCLLILLYDCKWFLPFKPVPDTLSISAN